MATKTYTPPRRAANRGARGSKPSAYRPSEIQLLAAVSALNPAAQEHAIVLMEAVVNKRGVYDEAVALLLAQGHNAAVADRLATDLVGKVEARS